MKINRSTGSESGSTGSENGSAILEYLIFALPLFLPLALFLQGVSAESQIQYDATNFARQLVRVYVTSPNQEDIAPRINTLVELFNRTVFEPDDVALPAAFRFSCEANPCLTPKARVQVDVELKSTDGRSRATARVHEFVNAWGGG